MNRIPARYAAQLLGISRQTIHKWAREGRITRTPDGYDVNELMHIAAESRDLNALLSRAGIRYADRPA